MKPLCLYGGTFDPPHIAHLIHAQLLLDFFQLPEVLFLLSANPPHKRGVVVTELHHRLRMLQLAIEDNQRFKVSTHEIERGGLSYSIDSIRFFKKKYSLDRKELYFVIGADSLLDFANWKEPEAILKESQVLVLPRPGFDPSQANSNYISSSIILNFPRIEISATFIRRRVKEGKSIKYLVPEKVEKYIYDNSLYR